MEGSLWVYGRTRLADYYSGLLTFREIVNRFVSLPLEAPVWAVLREEAERTGHRQKAAEIDQTLAPFQARR